MPERDTIQLQYQGLIVSAEIVQDTKESGFGDLFTVKPFIFAAQCSWIWHFQNLRPLNSGDVSK
jgi:hypothetical protein